MIPGLDTLIDAILGTATTQLQDRIQRSETVIKLLKRLNLDPDHPPTDFTAIYQYALVEYGVGKPKPVLSLFRRPEIQQTFRQAFEQNNFPLLEQVSQEVIEAHEFGDEIQQLGINLRRELLAFSAVFIGVAKRSRTPAEVLRDQQARSLHQHLFTLQERLDRLPTIEGIRTEMARLVGEEILALPAAEQENHWAQQCRAYALSQQMRGWFETLGFRFESYEVWEADYFEWIINVPVRRGRYDRILVRGIDGEAGLPDVMALRQSVEQQRTDEGWLVTARRISRAARDEVEKEENNQLGCYTLDELLDQDADFSSYLDWLEQEIQKKQIAQTYVPLACTKEEFDPVTRQRIGVSRYDERDGWIDGYIDLWLDDPAKEHISVLGEFGTGKTWFALHYAWQALQRYKEAKRRGLDRPRLPLVIPLRDYAKAVSVESLFSEFFFRKYEIPIPGYSAFEQLNRMGKLLLIFDGFDEMAARVDRQEMINNFWELAKVVVPGAKVILTCRTEHFPEAKEGRALLNAELQASTKSLTGETPQFEVLELEKFNDDQIRQVLSFQAQPATVEQVMGNPQLLDLARRPVMTELILEALPDIEAGKPIDMSRIYLYAVRRKMERDIKAERTFTSMADKLYFLCELSWEMLSTDRMSINYREFPDRIRRLFGSLVQEERDLDHWHYDMMGQTMLIRNAAGDYTPAHRSLLEFFVAYKFAAELGAISPDFLELAQMRLGIDNSLESQEYQWSEYFDQQVNIPLKRFRSEDLENLQSGFGKAPLTQAVLDLLVPILLASDSLPSSALINCIETTRGKTDAEAGYVGGNAATLLLKLDKAALENKNLADTVLQAANFSNASLRRTNFACCDLSKSSFTQSSGSFLSIAFSKDGEYLVAGGIDSFIYFWDLKTGKQQQRWKAEHQDWIRSIALSPDGSILASGSEDKTVKLWNTATGKCLHTLAEHTRWIRSIAFNPDGNVIASGSDDHTIRLWNVATGQGLSILKGHTRVVRSVAYSPNGKILASGSSDQTIRLWDVKTGNCSQILKQHTQGIRSIAFSPDGQLLATGSSDQTVKIWHIDTGKCLNTLQGHDGWVWSVSFSPDGKILASSSEDQTVRLWDMRDIEASTCLNTLSGHTSWIRSVVFSPDGQTFATSSDDQTIRIWNLQGQCLKILQSYSNSVHSIAFSPNELTLASGGDDQAVRLWNARTGRCLTTSLGHTNRIWSIAFSPMGDILASGSEDRSIRLWDLAGKCLKTLEGHRDGIRSVAFTSNGCLLASGSSDRMVRLWDVDKGQCLAILSGHTDWVYAVAFSPDGETLASGSSDTTIKIWNVKTRKCLKTLAGHGNGIRSVTFSPDGKTLASSSTGRVIRLWNVETGQNLKELELQEDSNGIPSITFSSNNYVLASGTDDGIARLWNIHSGQCQVLEGHTDRVRSVAFSSCGKILASGSKDGTIRLWDSNTCKCLKTLTDRPYEGMNITRVKGLTEAEKDTLKALGAIEN